MKPAITNTLASNMSKNGHIQVKRYNMSFVTFVKSCFFQCEPKLSLNVTMNSYIYTYSSSCDLRPICCKISSFCLSSFYPSSSFYQWHWHHFHIYTIKIPPSTFNLRSCFLTDWVVLKYKDYSSNLRTSHLLAVLRWCLWHDSQALYQHPEMPGEELSRRCRIQAEAQCCHGTLG